MEVMMKQKLNFLIISLLLLAIAITGCSNKGTNNTASDVKETDVLNNNDEQVIVTIDITVPEPLEDNLAIAMGSNLNNWNPSTIQTAEKIDDTHYRLHWDLTSTVEELLQKGSLTKEDNGDIQLDIEYKWTLQKMEGLQEDNWSMVELSSEGQDLSNRTMRIVYEENFFEDEVIRFKQETEEIIKESTLTGTMETKQLEFIPYGNGSMRTIRIWLPEGYDASDKKTKYPVLYMHDAQNLFDRETAFQEEWEIDETITEFMKGGYEGTIVVGIDNSPQRTSELWPTFLDSTSTGEKYAEFIVKTVKPYIDNTYNVKSDREHTGIGGSSLGGVMSLYMGLAYPDIFGYELCFSPALVYWDDALLSRYISSRDFSNPNILPKIFIYSGGFGIDLGSGTDEKSLTKYVDIIKNHLLNNGYPANKINTSIDEEMSHNEEAWKQYFKVAYKWLVEID